MAYDPLSDRTRLAKRNLMAVSLLAIAYRTFNLDVKEAEIGGTKLTIQPDVIPFLLAATAVWFAVSFAISWYLDLKNPGEDQFTSNLKARREKNYALACEHVTESIKIRVPAFTQQAIDVNDEIANVVKAVLYSDTDDEKISSALRGCFKSKFLGTGPDAIKKAHEVSMEAVYEGRGVIASEERELVALERKIALWYRIRDVGLDFVIPSILGVSGLMVLWLNPDMAWLKHALPPLNVRPQ